MHDMQRAHHRVVHDQMSQVPTSSACILLWGVCACKIEMQSLFGANATFLGWSIVLPNANIYSGKVEVGMKFQLAAISKNKKELLWGWCQGLFTCGMKGYMLLIYMCLCNAINQYADFQYLSYWKSFVCILYW